MGYVSAGKRAHFPYPDAYLAFCLLKCKVSSGKSYLCPLELSLICPPVRQFQFETTPSFNQLGWNPYDFTTDGSCHLLFLLISQSCLLEPVHEVMGQHNQLKIEPGSCPAPANTLVQPKSINAFFGSPYKAVRVNNFNRLHIVTSGSTWRKIRCLQSKKGGYFQTCIAL